jgi:hypothetical protein
MVIQKRTKTVKTLKMVFCDFVNFIVQSVIIPALK